MRNIRTSVLCVCAIMAMPLASALAQQTPQVQAKNPRTAVPNVQQYTVDPFASAGSASDQQQRVPLFKIGNLPVQIWAPVPEPYDANANRTFASDPTWGTTMAMNQPPF